MDKDLNVFHRRGGIGCGYRRMIWPREENGFAVGDEGLVVRPKKVTIVNLPVCITDSDSRERPVAVTRIIRDDDVEIRKQDLIASLEEPGLECNRVGA